jgi:hypothetical protein
MNSHLCRYGAPSRLTRDPATGKLCRCYPPLDPCNTCPAAVQVVFSGLAGTFAGWNGSWTLVRGSYPLDECRYYLTGVPPSGWRGDILIGQGAWAVGLAFVDVPPLDPPACQIWWAAAEYASCPPYGAYPYSHCQTGAGCDGDSCPAEGGPYPACTVSEWP